MTEIQLLITEKGGCPAFAKWSGEKARVVQSWKSGEHAPRPANAARIIREHKKDQVLALIQGIVDA